VLSALFRRQPRLIIIGDVITRITTEAITIDIITVAITTVTVITEITIYTGLGFPGRPGIIAIGKRTWRRAPSCVSPLFELARVLVPLARIATVSS
jgi:uncharacterized membrane protein YdbT with pleckstrin-like domain